MNLEKIPCSQSLFASISVHLHCPCCLLCDLANHLDPCLSSAYTQTSQWTWTWTCSGERTNMHGDHIQIGNFVSVEKKPWVSFPVRTVSPINDNHFYSLVNTNSHSISPWYGDPASWNNLVKWSGDLHWPIGALSGTFFEIFWLIAVFIMSSTVVSISPSVVRTSCVIHTQITPQCIRTVHAVKK
jgi:hypothetical protein